MLWKYQVRPSILWSYSLLDFIDGTQLNPEKYLLDKSGTTLKGENPLNQQRKGRDQELQTLINVTLSLLALSLVVEQDITQGVGRFLNDDSVYTIKIILRTRYGC